MTCDCISCQCCQCSIKVWLRCFHFHSIPAHSRFNIRINRLNSNFFYSNSPIRNGKSNCCYVFIFLSLAISLKCCGEFVWHRYVNETLITILQFDCTLLLLLLFLLSYILTFEHMTGQI